MPHELILSYRYAAGKAVEGGRFVPALCALPLREALELETACPYCGSVGEIELVGINWYRCKGCKNGMLAKAIIRPAVFVPHGEWYGVVRDKSSKRKKVV